ncbi:hypothetical protein Gpo141_00006553 [Globisporangium polare]
MRLYEEARWLLQQYLSELARTQGHHDGQLFVLCSDRASGTFLPKKTWINVDIGNASSATLKKLRAFMEIIGRLSASADFQWCEFYHAFWKDALMKPLTCTVCTDSVGGNANTNEFDNFEQLMNSEGPRFILDFSKTEKGRSQVDMLHKLILMDPEDAVNEKHKSILAKLTGQSAPEPTTKGRRSAKKAKKSSQVAAVPVAGAKIPQVEIGVVLPALGHSTAEFRDLAQLLEDIVEHESLENRTTNSVGVRYDISTLWIASNKSLGSMEIEILSDLLASEWCTIRHVSFEKAMTMLTVMESLRAFGQLLRSSVCSLGGSQKPILETIQLYDAPFENHHVAPICSALRHPSSLTRLHVDWSEPGMRDDAVSTLMWAWIAYGIFHPDSEAKLNRLNLSGPPLKIEDTTAFASILRSPHPGRALWILEHGDLPQGSGLDEVPLPAGQRLFIQLKAKTKFRAFPKPRSPALEQLVVDSDEFEVAIELESWICVVVPGCGFGWAPSASVVSRREVASKCLPEPLVVNESQELELPRAGDNVTIFDRYTLLEEDHEDWSDEEESDPDDWRTGPDAVEAIKALLTMIGQNLQGLNYPSHDVDISDADFTEVLTTCPNLKQLNLFGNALTNLTPLVERYRAQQCRISSLNIHTVEGHDEIMTQLAELLEDPISKPLQYVAVNGMVQNPDCVARLATALRSNDSLQLLYFYSVNPEDREIFSRLQTEFESVKRVSRLRMKTKVAFLSTIEAHAKREGSSRSGRLATTSSSLSKLDSSIASQIFAFAGIPFPRTVIW